MPSTFILAAQTLSALGSFLGDVSHCVNCIGCGAQRGLVIPVDIKRATGSCIGANDSGLLRWQRYSLLVGVLGSAGFGVVCVGVSSM